MHVSAWLLALALTPARPASAYTPASTNATDQLATAALDTLDAAVRNGSLAEALAAHDVAPPCDMSRAAVRREYSTLSDAEKLEYIRAVKCLMAAPSQLPPGVAPGARSRYDDFVAVHINRTTTVHATGQFLHWHRFYIFSFEQALREECGYAAYLPYWNWGKSAQDPLHSPYMDGSATSQGGNGAWRPHNCTRPGSWAPCIAPVVPGRGGGCVETGPYVGVEANLSTVESWYNWPHEPVGPFLGYQPRCLVRDISPELTRALAGDEHLVDLLTRWDAIGPFQDQFQALTGLHATGHFTYSGNPGGDIYTSPNDMLFWIHHGMVDRAWWAWQNQKPVERAFQIAGTRTMNNNPPSDNATIDDILDLGIARPANVSTVALKHHVSTVAGPYCYIYS